MTHTKHSLAVLLAVFPIVLCLVVLLNGCDKSNEKTIISSDNLISSCQAGAPTSLIRLAIPYAPLTFNPVTARDRVSRLIAAQFTATLYRYHPIQDVFEPGLAKSFTRSKDNKTFVITLRKGVTFSDGSNFTARDVVSSIDYIRKPDVRSPLSIYLEIEGKPLVFSEIDTYTLRCVSPQPHFAMEAVLSRIPILPAKLIEKAENPAQLLAGDTPAGFPVIGPFQLKSIAHNQMVLERNPRYWIVDAVGRTLPYADEVQFSIIKTPAEMSLKFRIGALDAIDHVVPTDFLRLRNIRELQTFDTGASFSTLAAWWNQKTTDLISDEKPAASGRAEWFRMPAFRKATAQCFGGQRIVDTTLAGLGVLTRSLFTENDGGWYLPVEAAIFNPAAAKTDLTQNRFSITGNPPTVTYGSLDVEFSILLNSADQHLGIAADNLENNLRTIGIRASVLPLPPDQYFRRLYQTRDFDLAIGWVDIPYHPLFSREILHSRSNGNLWNPHQAKPSSSVELALDQSLDRIYTLPDWSGRLTAAHDVQKKVGDNYLFLQLVKPHGLFAAKGNLHNVAMNHRNETLVWNLEEWYMTAQ